MQYINLEETVYLYFAANDTSGSGGDGVTPLFDVREGGGLFDDAPTLSGTATLLANAAYPSGCHEVVIPATAGNGFSANKTYAVFVTLLVDSQNPTGYIGSFKTSEVPAKVQIMDPDVINNSSIKDAAISATKFATDAIDANALAADAVTEIQSGLSTFNPATDPVANVTLVATTTTNTDMRGTDGAYTGTPPTIDQISDQVWIEQIGDHSGVSGSTAEALAAAGGAGDPWITPLPGAYGAGTAGFILGTNLDALVTSRSTFNAASDVVANVTLVATTTTNTDMRGTDNASTFNPAIDTVANVTTTANNSDMRGTDSAYTGTPPTVDQIADQVWIEILADHSGVTGSAAEALAAAGTAGDPWITSLPGSYGVGTAGFILGGNINLPATGLDLIDIDGFSLPLAISIISAGIAGKVSGVTTGEETFRDIGDTVDRMVTTVDASGNRTAIVYP